MIGLGRLGFACVDCCVYICVQQHVMRAAACCGCSSMLWVVLASCHRALRLVYIWFGGICVLQSVLTTVSVGLWSVVYSTPFW